MSPNSKQKQCAERCAEGVHVTTKRRNTCGSAGFGFNYQPTEEIEKKAIGYLMGKSKVLPGVLAVAIGIHRNTAGKVCIYLWTAGKLLRDGRSYTWNPIGKEDASRLYRRFVADMLAYVDTEITNRGQHNKKLSNAYANGASDSWVTGRQWTDNLKKIRIGLRNCIEVQNNALLIILAQELSRECPTFMGDLYHRTKEEEADLVAERRMAYAARKPRIGKDDAFHAARQAKVAARQAAAKAARLEAERLLRAKAEGLLLQMDADQSKLGIAMQTHRPGGTGEVAAVLAPRGGRMKCRKCGTGIVAELTKQEIDRHKADCRRGRKPTRHQLKAQAAAAEKSRLWVLARLNLPGGGDAKYVL